MTAQGGGTSWVFKPLVKTRIPVGTKAECQFAVTWKTVPFEKRKKVYSSLQVNDQGEKRTVEMWRIFSTRNLYLHLPEARQIAKNVTKFVFGTGIDVGQTNSLVMYASPTLEKLRELVKISKSVPL